MLTISYGQAFPYIRESVISTIKREAFISDRKSYKTLRHHWCVIILNVNTPTRDKRDNIKDSFYEELQCVLHQLPKYNMRILLRDFNENIGTGDIFKPTVGNENLP